MNFLSLAFYNAPSLDTVDFICGWTYESDIKKQTHMRLVFTAALRFEAATKRSESAIKIVSMSVSLS